MKKGKVKVSDLIKNTGTKKYLKFDTGNKETAQLDEEKIKRSERWDGIYGIVSSHEKSQVGGDELFERYKGLWQVEEAFRVNKHDLKNASNLSLDFKENKGASIDLLHGICLDSGNTIQTKEGKCEFEY